MSKEHDKAMACIDHALAARRQGDEKEAQACFAQALKWERKAFRKLADPDGMGGAILRRSAGWLALECDRPRLAKRLAEEALATCPHPKLAMELRALLAKIKGGEKMKASLENDCIGLSPNNERYESIYVRPSAVVRVDRSENRLHFRVCNDDQPIAIHFRDAEGAKDIIARYVNKEADFIRVNQGEGFVSDNAIATDDVYIRHSAIVRAEERKGGGAVISIYLYDSPKPIILAYDSHDHAEAALRAIWEGREP